MATFGSFHRVLYRMPVNIGFPEAIIIEGATASVGYQYPADRNTPSVQLYWTPVYNV